MKHPKMDKYLVSKQKWEIHYIRIIFYRMDGDFIEHPSVLEVTNAVKNNGRSRTKVYKELELFKYKRITVKAS